MRIERIRIQNYRGAINCDVNLARSRNISVFAGSNGSGKTSLIEACRLALGQMYGLRPMPAYPFEITVDILGDDGRRYVFRRNRETFNAQVLGGELIDPSNEAVARAIGLVRNWYFTSWRDPQMTDGVDLQTENKGLAFLPGATREQTLVVVKNALVRWSVTAQFNNDAQQIDHVRVLFDRMNAAWNMFFPNRPSQFVARSVGQVLSANGFEVDPVGSNFKFDLYLSRSNDLKLLSVNDLSSGEIEVFCFLGVLVLNEWLGTVYIDEPELHLNQQWHSTLIRAMQVVAPNVQFIVATHSPETWNSVNVDQRFFIQEGFLRA